jgi:hypothetical protein
MSSPEDNLLSTDPGRELLVMLVRVMKTKLERALLPPWLPEKDQDGKAQPNPEYVNMMPAEMQAVLKLLQDNSVTLANVRRGDFGDTAKRVEEEFPFPDNTMGTA